MTRYKVSPLDREVFRKDGVVALRDAFDPEWIEMLTEAIEASIADPGPNLGNHSKDPSAPAYLEDFWSWSSHPGFKTFVHQSPCAPIAAQLLGAERINLVMDNWFRREAGASSRPPFHQDLAYFDFTGSMCVLWLPLEPVTKENGIGFVRGSHLWNKLFMRVRFDDGHRVDAGDGSADQVTTINGVDYHAPPDVNAAPEDFDIAQFDLNLGDCLYFDMRTLHGGLSARPQTKTATRYTLRMTAEDGLIRYRGDWAKEERAMFEAAGYGDGDRIDGAFFPRLWSA